MGACAVFFVWLELHHSGLITVSISVKDKGSHFLEKIVEAAITLTTVKIIRVSYACACVLKVDGIYVIYECIAGMPS